MKDQYGFLGLIISLVSLSSCSSDSSYVCKYVPFVSDATNLHTSATTATREHVYIKNISTGAITLVSKDSSGTEGDGDSIYPTINKDCTFVVYHTGATNLVSDDTNGQLDVVRYKISDGTNALVSSNSAGAQRAGTSRFARISQDGNLIVFSSNSTDLVDSDTNGNYDIFLKNMTSGAISRVSVDSDEAEGAGVSNFSDISFDGRYVVFQTTSALDSTNDTNGGTGSDVYLRDITEGTTTLVSKLAAGTAIGGSTNPKISGNGDFIVYDSTADPLELSVSTRQVYRFARTAGTTTRVSSSADGTVANSESVEPAVSEDGVRVTFESEATNLGSVTVAGSTPQVYIKNISTAAVVLVNQKDGTSGDGQVRDHIMTADSKFIVWSTGSTNLTGTATSGIQLFSAPLDSRDSNVHLSKTAAGAAADSTCAAIDVAEAG